MINNSHAARKEEYEELNGNCLLLSPWHSNLSSCRTQNYSTFPCLCYHHSFNPLSACFLPFHSKTWPLTGWFGFVSLNMTLYLHLFPWIRYVSMYGCTWGKVYIVTGFYLPACSEFSMHISKPEISETPLLSGSLMVFTEYTRWVLGSYCSNGWNIKNSSMHLTPFLCLDPFLFRWNVSNTLPGYISTYLKCNRIRRFTFLVPLLLISDYHIQKKKRKQH